MGPSMLSPGGPHVHSPTLGILPSELIIRCSLFIRAISSSAGAEHLPRARLQTGSSVRPGLVGEVGMQTQRDEGSDDGGA